MTGGGGEMWGGNITILERRGSGREKQDGVPEPQARRRPALPKRPSSAELGRSNPNERRAGYKRSRERERGQSISSDDSHPGPLLDRGPNQLPCRIPARVPSGVALSPVDVLTNCDGPGETYSPVPFRGPARCPLLAQMP